MQKQLNLTLNTNEVKHSVSMNGNPVKLTLQEYLLLETLIENEGKIVSRDSLLRNVWNCVFPIQTRTVDMHIQRLRKKLGRQLIETIYGQGYRFVLN